MEPIFGGGLMRCCIQTLHERTEAAEEGEVQRCRWCSSGAVFRDGGWRRMAADRAEPAG